MRGLKFNLDRLWRFVRPSRTLPGVRGLKFTACGLWVAKVVSHPTRGAWIEMVPFMSQVEQIMSHPTRGAWIEIYGVRLSFDTCRVAPYPGCVD